MSRYFMIQSWVGSHENEPDYNGQQAGERNVRSSEVVPLYDKNGRANTQYFSDEAIAERMGKAAKKTSTSIEDRILPQAKRIRVLTEQLIELEAERKAGMSIEKYSKLRDILIVKRDRAQVLYEKAVSVKPVNTEETQPHTDPSKPPQHTRFPEQIATFSSNKARHSAKGDAKLFLGGVCLCFMAFTVLKMFM